DLLLVEPHPAVDVGEHGRVDEVALPVEPVPARDHLNAIVLALVDEAHDARELLLADQRPTHAALFLGPPGLIEFATSATPSTTWSYTPRCTKMRDPQTQPWPECTKIPIDA